jgi:peptide chain release factor 1
MIMANIEEANEIADNSDADMTEMAKMQLDEAKERLPELEEEIKFMLIPKESRRRCDGGNSCRYRWG